MQPRTKYLVTGQKMISTVMQTENYNYANLAKLMIIVEIFASAGPKVSGIFGPA